jgi:hypothetical protein
MMMPIESNRECFYLGMHYVHAFSRVLNNKPRIRDQNYWIR